MNANIFGTKRNIDVVFCIDATGSMTPCLNKVKENICKFHTKLASDMEENFGTELGSLRVKVIAFRDYEDGATLAMTQSSFFELPANQAEFSGYMAGITAMVGGDPHENGLEALYYAMKSDFITGPRSRQIIILLTDADALDLGERSYLADYPADMIDENGLIDLWNHSTDIHDPSVKLGKGKRLVMFAPSGTKYDTLHSDFDNCIFHPVEDHTGLGDVTFDTVIKLIAVSSCT